MTAMRRPDPPGLIENVRLGACGWRVGHGASYRTRCTIADGDGSITNCAIG